MDKIVKIDGVTMRDANLAPDKINIDGVDYINKQSLMSFIEDAIAENLEEAATKPEDEREYNEGYHEGCWRVLEFIKQMCK